MRKLQRFDDTWAINNGRSIQVLVLEENMPKEQVNQNGLFFRTIKAIAFTEHAVFAFMVEELQRKIGDW